jgi:hypothetical protein
MVAWSASASGAEHDPGVAAHLRPERKGEKCQRDPWPQVWPDPANSSFGVELADHRVGELERTDGAITQEDSSRPVPDFLMPMKPLHAAIYGAEENSQMTDQLEIAEPGR